MCELWPELAVRRQAKTAAPAGTCRAARPRTTSSAISSLISMRLAYPYFTLRKAPGVSNFGASPAQVRQT